MNKVLIIEDDKEISSMPINNKKILNRIFPDSGKNVS